LIPRLLANEHDLGRGCTFAKNSLRGAFPQIAGTAIFSLLLQGF
jgi:hypothetical protein